MSLFGLHPFFSSLVCTPLLPTRFVILSERSERGNLNKCRNVAFPAFQAGEPEPLPTEARNTRPAGFGPPH